MATTVNKNLFYQLYSKSNDVASSGYVCSSAIDENDTSFDIDDDLAVITDSNGDELAAIDLSEIHADELTQYITETKILQPYSAYLLLGLEYGETFKSQWFKVCELKNYEGYEEYCNIAFDILYKLHCNKQCFKRFNIRVNTTEIRTTYGPFVELAQLMLDTLNVPVTVSLRTLADECCAKSTSDYIVFESQKEAYDFMIRNVCLFPIMADENYPDSPFKGPNMDLDWITMLFELFKPRFKGYKTKEKDYLIDCGIYREFIKICEFAIIDFNTFCYELEVIKTNFLPLFDEYGICLFPEQLKLLAEKYPEIYNKYFSPDSPLSEFNIYDIVEMLEYIRQYIFDSMIDGPHFCLENINKRVDACKYPNGAMRGIVIIPDWPETEEEEYLVLWLNHVADRIELMVPVDIESLRKYFGGDIVSRYKARLYEKAIATVKINALITEEKLEYIEDVNALPLNDITSNDGFTTTFDYMDTAGYDTRDFVNNKFHRLGMSLDPETRWNDNHIEYHDPAMYVDENKDDENVWENHPNKARYHYVDTHENLKEKMVGLYKYMHYLTDNDLWLRIGDGYMIVGKKDTPSSTCKNLLLSVLIYNPNNIPIRIKYMIFS